MIGFTEQMSDWMAAADAMVHSTAGLTVLEAHIRGCPVVSYGFSAGTCAPITPPSSASGWPRSPAPTTSSSRSCATSPASAARRTPPSPRCPRSPRACSPYAPGSSRSRSGACAPGGSLPRSPRSSRSRPGRRCSRGRPRNPLQGDLQGRAARGAHPLRQGRTRPRGRPQPAAKPRRRPAAPPRPPHTVDRGRWPAPAFAAAALHAGPALAPVVPGHRPGAGDRPARRTGADGVALTFDDGPHPQGTPAVLETLREARRPATFFLAGEQVSGGPPWWPRSSPPATGSSCTATATATSCG